jgi:hypothetical protein
MARKFDQTGFEDALTKYAKFIFEDLGKREYEEWKSHLDEGFDDRKKRLLFDEFGFEDDSTPENEPYSQGGVFIEDPDLTEDEIRTAVEAYKKRQESGRGPESKTAKWAERIQSGDATLEEAKEELPESTFYKMKREYDVGD